MHIVLLGLLLSPLVTLPSHLVLKLQINLIIILLLFCGTVSYLISFICCSSCHSINSSVSNVLPLFFLKVENPSLSLFLSSLVSNHQGYLRIDISVIDQALLFHLIHISLSFTVISFHLFVFSITNVVNR